MKSSAAALFLLLAMAEAFRSPPSLSSRAGDSRHTITSRVVELRAATLEAPPTEVAAEDPQADGEEEEFVWTKNWYPLVPVEILDLAKPHKFRLFGTDVVVWNDGPLDNGGGTFQPKKDRPKNAKKSEGTWRVFVDSCPHRRVPLSEGRIEDDGSLLCSYHGWRFDGDGKAVAVPQVDSNELELIKSNPKSDCGSYPVTIVDGLMYVWPETGSDARIESALADVPVNDRFDQADAVKDGSVWKGPWSYRELPYGHDYFLENVVDPAHVPISHHNVVGSRYGDQTLNLKTGKPLDKTGFSIVSPGDAANAGGSSTTFKAPSQVLIEAKFGDGAKQWLELYTSPSRPGFCNHVGRMVIQKDASGGMPQLLRAFTAPLPKWLNHLLAPSFLNQDALFLHGQERSLTFGEEYVTSRPQTGKKAGDSYASAVMPCSADRGVMMFRSWMAKYGKGFIPFQGDKTMPPVDNNVVFDVWNSHTKHCKYCLGALRNIGRIRAMSFLASALVASLRPRILGVLGSTAAAAGLAGVGLVMTKLIGLFYKFEFSHADNH